MGAYVTRRLLTSIPTLLVIVTVAFFMMRVAPGGPFDRERALPAEIEKNVLEAYNLDQPLLLQYRDYLLGRAARRLRPVVQISRLHGRRAAARPAFRPASRSAASRSRLAIAARHHARHARSAAPEQRASTTRVMATAMTGIAIPNFVMAPLLTLIFGVWLRWLPVAGWNGGAAREPDPAGDRAGALPQIAYIARLTRGSMIEVLHANYIRTARAKGLRERVVVVRHALKGAPCCRWSPTSARRPPS